MTTVYALFLCFQALARCEAIPGPPGPPMASLDECRAYMARYTPGGYNPGNGIVYRCMKAEVPIWTPAEPATR